MSNVDNARFSWNNSGAGTTILKSADSLNTIEIDDEGFGSTWYGVYFPDNMIDGVLIGPYVGTFTMTSTVAHEFGHAYYLDDFNADNPNRLQNHHLWITQETVI